MANTDTKVLIKDELVLDLIDSMIEIHSEKDMFKQYLKKSARKCYREYSYEIYIDTYDKLIEYKYYDPVKHGHLFQTVAYQVYVYLNNKNLWE